MTKPNVATSNRFSIFEDMLEVRKHIDITKGVIVHLRALLKVLIKKEEVITKIETTMLTRG